MKKIFTLIFVCQLAAASQCHVFTFFSDSSTPEPVKIDCSSKAKTLAQCKSLCLPKIKKQCKKKDITFTGNINFSSSAGFEVDNFEGTCS